MYHLLIEGEELEIIWVDGSVLPPCKISEQLDDGKL